MNATGWALFVACNIVSGVVGAMVGGFVAEQARYRRWRRRDAEWVAAHGIRPPEAAP